MGLAGLGLLGACAPTDSGSAGVPPPEVPVEVGTHPAGSAMPTTTTSVAYVPTTVAPTPPLLAVGGACGAAAPAAVRPTPAPPPAEESPGPLPTTPPTPATALAGLLADPRLGGGTVSVSVRLDGVGEVIAHNADVPLVPASNQKLVTALGALALLGPDTRLVTELLRTGPVVDGELRGDLVLVAGGDPTLVHAGAAASIDALGETVRAAGIERVAGRLVIDASRYDDRTSGPDWPPSWPESNGPLSALVVNRNKYRGDAAFLADPSLANADVLRAALALRGIEITGATGHGRAETGIRLGSVTSPTVAELVQLVLYRSDNLAAELLVKEIGHRSTGGPGTTADGLAAIREVMAASCVSVQGVDADGSGLSYANQRSARELVALLDAARAAPWGPTFTAALPVAGQLGAFGGRLAGPVTAGRVRAKTGSLALSRALSGYLTTTTGRSGTFAVIVNGGRVGDAEDAIDDFVTAVVQLP